MLPSRALRRVGIVLGLAVLGFVLYRLHGQWQSLDFSWSRLRWPDIGASLLLLVAAQALFAFSWHRLLSDAGESGELRGDVARWCVSLAGKYFPGKVWQAVARFGLYHGAERGKKVAPAFVRETLLSLSAAMAVVAAHGWSDVAATGRLELAFSIGSLALLLLSLPGVARTAAGFIQRWMPMRLVIPEGGVASLVEVWAMQLAGYLVLGLGCLFLARGIGIAQADITMPVVAGLCFAGLAGIAAFFVPAGIGVREAALVWYLAPVIGPAPAALLAVAARVWISVGEAALVAAGMLVLNRSARGVEPAP